MKIIKELDGGCILVRYKHDKNTIYAFQFNGDHALMFERLKSLAVRANGIHRIKIKYSGVISLKDCETLVYSVNGNTIHVRNDDD